MNTEIVLLAPVLLILVAILLLWRSGSQREALGVPAGDVVYQDAPGQRRELLRSKRYDLVGRPDSLIKQGDMIIPVETKTGKTPERPYYGHTMQLIAYCVLVEETYGVRPTHGIIHYPQGQFEIKFTEALEQELAIIIDDMKQKKYLETVARNHNNPRVCAACSYRSTCDERLEEQLPLIPDG